MRRRYIWNKILAHWYVYLLDYYRELLPNVFYGTLSDIQRDSADFDTYRKIIGAYIQTTRRIRERGIEFTRQLQEVRLKKTFRQAMQTTWWPTYLRSYGIDATSIRTFADIERIPPTTREALKSAPLDQLRSAYTAKQEELQVHSTSGSTTGTPFQTLFLKNAAQVTIAAHFLDFFKNNGVPVERLMREKFIIAFNLFGGERPLPLLTHFLTYIVTPKGGDATPAVRELAQTAARFGCILYTHPSELRFLIQKLREEGLRPRFFLCVVVGQVLDETVRDAAEDFFQTRVLSMYGFREASIIATECPKRRGAFHAEEVRCRLEVLDNHGINAGENELGNLTFTMFDNPIMPLIRYQPGDIGRVLKGPCNCGNPYQLFELEDRQSDMLEFPDGTNRRTRTVSQIFAKEPFLSSIVRYQIRQEAPDKIRILVVLTKNTDADTLCKEIASKVRTVAQIPDMIQIEVQQTPLIDVVGKYKTFVSLQTIRAMSNNALEKS